MKLWCRLRGHQRSRRLAVMGDDGLWHSRCERCDAPLVRRWQDGWVRDRQAS